MGTRRHGRELALQTLYSMEFGEVSMAEALAGLRGLMLPELPPGDNEEPDEDDPPPPTPEAMDFAERLVRGATAKREAIDQLLSQCSTNWKVERMARVDRNILRVATYELRYVPEIPPKVTINEAIEIAKRYGSQDSSAFINGILDRIAGLAPLDPSGG